jgi:hypothetical protein
MAGQAKAGQLTVRRVGGPLPTLRPSKTWQLDDLDDATCAALRAFGATAGRQRAAAHAGAMSYVFELTGPDAVTVSVAFTQIPESLHPLLPGPGPR